MARSTVHRLEQPSWLSRLPSSQDSLGSISPLPQVSGDRQSAEQPPPETFLPSSHTSPGSRRPSPHGGPQSAGQPSPETLLPSSHTSPGSRRPSPQLTGTQSGAWSASMQRRPGGHTPPPGQSLDSGCVQLASTAATASTGSHPPAMF